MEVGGNFAEELQKSQPLSDAGDSRLLKVGDAVMVGATQLRGTLQFYGSTEFSTGDWMGVALNEPAGKNDGSVKGVRYFTCEQGYGLFIRPNTCVIDMDATSVAVEAAKPEEGTGSKGKAKESTATEQPRPKSEPKPTSPKASKGSASTTAAAPQIQAPQKVSEAALREAQHMLAEAMEDHDVDRLRRALPVAASLGVSRTELDGALRVLNFEVQQALFREVEDVRSVVAQLAESVALAEARALESEDSARRVVTGGSISSRSIPAPPEFGAQPSEAWIEQVGARLEERLWSGLQRRVEATVAGAVGQATQALIAAVNEMREVGARGDSSPKKKAKARFQMSEEEAATRIQAISRGNLVRKRRTAQETSEAKFVVKWWLQSAASFMNNRLDIVESRRQMVEAAKRELGVGSGAVASISREDAAALKIQALNRGRLGRQKVAAVKAKAQPKAARKAMSQDQAASVIQRCARRYIRRKQGRDEGVVNCMGAVASNMMQRNVEWEKVFKENVSDNSEELACDQFSCALRAVHPRLSNGQVLVLWKGFCSGTGTQGVDWQAFYAIAEAVAIDDHCAAEFADVSVEVFRQLGVQGADDAATRLQAAARGRATRQQRANQRQLVNRGATKKNGAASNKQFSLHQERAASRLQALERGRASRAAAAKQQQDLIDKGVLEKEELSNATVNLQRAFRGIMARRKATGNKMTFGYIVSVVRTRYVAWSKIFDSVCEVGKATLQQSAFVTGFRQVHPYYSSSQARALWDGFVAAIPDCDGVDMLGFCSIVEAGHIGDEPLAEYADTPVEDWRALGDAGAAEDAQMEEDNWRKLRPDFAGFFDEARGSGKTLDEANFHHAITRAHPRLTKGQVHAMWAGYCKGTGREAWTLEDFGAAAEAVEIGDHAAAEFADIASEHFATLGAAGGEQAATKLQARIRGKKSRQSMIPAAKYTPEQMSAADRIQALERGRALRLGKQAAADAKTKAADRIQAMERARAVRSESQASKKQLEEDTAKQVEAATKMQCMFRIFSARRKIGKLGSGADAFFKAATVVKAKHAAWVEIFDEAVGFQLGAMEGTNRNLLQAGFVGSLRKVHPDLSEAQVDALWSGTIDGMGAEDVDVRTFCTLCQAVAAGHDRAAEFADMAVQDFAALGSKNT